MTLPVRPAPQRSLLACTCFLALAALGCGVQDERSRRDESTLTVLYCCDEWELGPAEDDAPQRLVFLTLARLDEHGDPQPRLAESWEHSPDYRTWTIRLRRDVRWHDGHPVTAHDVLFSMELWTHPEVLYWTVGPIRSSSIEGDYTLTVTFSKPTMDPLDGWSSIYPKHLLEELDPEEFYRWEFWTHPVGNGPYRYVRHVPKTMMEFEANPDFYLGKPRIGRVVLKFGTSALVELLSGNVDAASEAVSASDALKLAGDPRFRVYRRANEFFSWALIWNHEHPLFRDARVRRALTLAIDRRELHRVLNLPEDRPLFDAIFTARQFRRGELGEALPYEPQRAKQLLEEAGWRDTDGDRIRERGGVEAHFTVLVRASPGGAGAIGQDERAAVVIQEQLRRVGVLMDFQALASSVINSRIRRGEFEATLRTLPNYPSGILRGAAAVGLDRGWFGQASPVGYHNPELVRLLETADSTVDPAARDSLYREMREIFHTDLPVLFLWTPSPTSLVHRRVRGLEPPWRVDLFTYIEDLWLEDER
ncbi:MAG: peptide ABC transporter substrate-binding protein [Longimicrobiales bacterium]